MCMLIKSVRVTSMPEWVEDNDTSHGLPEIGTYGDVCAARMARNALHVFF